MNIFFYTTLFLFGTLFGSFASVIIYRLKTSEKGILFGRSHCGKCNKILKSIELIPIVSWVINRGKCKSCKQRVSSIYPFLEISTGILFALIGYFLIDFSLVVGLNIPEILKLIFWLSIGLITIIYTFYDILFLEVHEGIMLVGIIITFLALLSQSLGIRIIDFLPVGDDIVLGIKSIFIALGILIGLYIIMLKGLHEIWDILILVGCFSLVIFLGNSDTPIINGMIGALGIFSFFFLQIVISGGKWMGGGDLRIAILIGMILGTSLSTPGIFITYLVGSIIGIGFIIYGKYKNGIKAKLNTQIPFGPFLAVGFFITVFFRENILEIVNMYF